MDLIKHPTNAEYLLRMNQKEAAFLRKFFGGLNDMQKHLKGGLQNSNFIYELYCKLYEIVK
jgi:hypothetical protein